MSTDLTVIDDEDVPPKAGAEPPPYMQFIGIVETFFPRPNFKGDKALAKIWARSLREALAPYDKDVLIEAARTINRTRDPKKDGKKFPKPAECIAACEAAKKLKAQASPPLIETREAIEARQAKDAIWKAWRPDRMKHARDLCMTSLGRRAATEGWINALYDFCREEARLPNEQEIPKIIEDSQKVRALIAELRAVAVPDAMTRSFQAWGEAITRQSDELASEVLGGKAA